MHYVVAHWKRKLKRYRRLILLFTCLLLIGLGLLFLRQPQVVSYPAANEALIQEIDRLILLPSEVPTIATVSDVTLLTDQPFFLHAKNGDKLLIYRENNKAILYDPKAKKILEVGTLNSAEMADNPE